MKSPIQLHTPPGMYCQDKADRRRTAGLWGKMQDAFHKPVRVSQAGNICCSEINFRKEQAQKNMEYLREVLK